jgi:hypothetical protein
MKKHLVIIGILGLVVSLGLSGCTSPDTSPEEERNKFVGTWTLTSTDIVTLSLYSNGTCLYVISATDIETREKGTWELTEGVFINTLYQHPRTFTYSFSDNDTTLTLVENENGEVTIFKKL